MPHERDSKLLENRRIRSADGTLIAYYVSAPPYAGAPIILLAGGLGGPHHAWLSQIEYLGERFQFVTWDYRGLFGSSHPIPANAEAYGISKHLDDLQAVLTAEAIEQVSIIGWSMGVQVALETYRVMPERIQSLVLINGAAGRPLDKISALPGVGRMLGRLIGLSAYGHHLVAAATRTPRRRRQVAACLRRAGFVGPSVDNELFEQLVTDLAELNMNAYACTLRALAEHDASAVLPQVEVPTLVVSGDRDPFYPPALAHSMARQLRQSEILMVPGGHHYLCLEFPDLINLRMVRFFCDVGLC